MVNIKNIIITIVVGFLIYVPNLYAEYGQSKIYFGCSYKNIVDNYGKPNSIINNKEIKNGYVYTFYEENEKITEIYEFKNKKFFKFYTIRIFRISHLMDYIKGLKNDKNIKYINKLFAQKNNKVKFYMIERKNTAYIITYNYITKMIIEEKYPIDLKYQKLFNSKKRQ